MAEIGFPVFEGGMTLTKDDLNMLREFFDVQDTVLGRLIGFGIACGLDGSVRGDALRIEPGLAIDQDGRALLLDAPVTFAVPEGKARFTFVDPEAGGVTPVLVFAEKDEAAPECDEASCEPHAPLRIRSARVVLAPGRLRNGLAEFATDPLLRVTPLTVDRGEVRGDLPRLRDAILARIDSAGVRLSEAGRARLAGLVLDGIPAVRVYRAAFLNQVLFATIELMRCRALRTASCLPDEATPGVALGWLSVKGWDCRYRHSFAPPAGLAMALLGGSCGDPCSLLLAKLEAVLSSYVEPTAPAPADPPKTPPKEDDFVLCPPKGRFGYLEFDECRVIVPPAEIRPDWWKDYLVDPLRDPRPWFTDPIPEIYDVDPIDFFESGTIGLRPTFGTDAELTRDVLVDLLAGKGGRAGQPEVRIVTQAEADAIEGFSTQVNVSVADTVVLVRDAVGKVVSTGRISAQHTVRNVGAEVQAARNDAASAVSSIATMATQFEDAIADQVGAIQNKITADLATQLSTLQSGLEQLKNLPQQFQELASEFEAFGDVKTRVTTVETRIEDTRTTFETAVQDVRNEVRTRTDTVATQVNERIDTVVVNVGNAIAQASTRQPGTVLGKGAPTIEAREAEVRTEDLVGVIGGLREAVTAAATKRQLAGVEEKLAAGEEALRVIESSATVRVSSEQRTALADVFESLTDAAAGAGAPAAQLEDIRATIQNLRGQGL